jgi:DNA-binding HxlR family transcriptional regulator
LQEEDIINAISDRMSLKIFKTIATENTSDSKVLKKNLKLTSRQYYNRMSRLTKVGLIKRENGNYFLTSLGKVVYNAESNIHMASQCYWKLKAIDTLQGGRLNRTLPYEEYSKIVDKIIDVQEIREILKYPSTKY